jgi:hypothetical protein
MGKFLRLFFGLGAFVLAFLGMIMFIHQLQSDPQHLAGLEWMCGAVGASLFLVSGALLSSAWIAESGQGEWPRWPFHNESSLSELGTKDYWMK